MTDDPTPHEPTDPYEDALAARFEQAADGIDGHGLSRAGVTGAVAARSRTQRRRRTALVGVAAAVALLGSVAVAGTGEDGGTEVSTDDRADDGADAPWPGPCPETATGWVYTAGSGMEGYTPTFGDQERITTLTDGELTSAATLLQVLDQADPAAYVAFVSELSSDFSSSAERQAFAQAVRALHPYTGVNGEAFPDGDQRRAIDEYAATLPGDVFVGGAGPVPARYDQAELRRALALLRPLGIDEGAFIFSVPDLDQASGEVGDAFLDLVRSGAAPDEDGSYGSLTPDQLAVLDAYVEGLPDGVFVSRERLPRIPSGDAAAEKGDASDQTASTPVPPDGVRCEPAADATGTTAPGAAEADPDAADPMVVPAPETTTSAAVTSEAEAAYLEVEGPADLLEGPADVGDPIASLEIPALGLTRTVREGVAIDVLAQGPGHDPATAFPGQAGNAVISGHRTTYDQPFLDLDQLEPGDRIVVTTAQGEFTYAVDGSEVVDAGATEVLDDQGDDRLTLVTPHPRYSNAQRLVVHALLVGDPASSLAGYAPRYQPG